MSYSDPRVNRVLADAAQAAEGAYQRARGAHTREELETIVGQGADGTPTMRIDTIVEEAILDAVAPHRVNVLSEEAGFIDRSSAVTLVLDPLDGSANAAAGVPLCCFSAALALDTDFVEALTVWLATGEEWWHRRGAPSGFSTTGRRTLDGAAISLLRPHPTNRAATAAWWAVTERAARVRILSSSTLEAMLVAQGSTDGFADAGTDTHRLVDLAAALVVLPPAGGAVLDAFGRPIELDVDLTRRWSGVVGATPDLAAQLAATISTAATARRGVDDLSS